MDHVLAAEKVPEEKTKGASTCTSQPSMREKTALFKATKFCGVYGRVSQQGLHGDDDGCRRTEFSDPICFPRPHSLTLPQKMESAGDGTLSSFFSARLSVMHFSVSVLHWDMLMFSALPQRTWARRAMASLCWPCGIARAPETASRTVGNFILIIEVVMADGRAIGEQ